MRENLPVSDTISAAIASPAPSVATNHAQGAGVTAATLPVFPHRRATVDAAWRQARAWIGVAYPLTDLDAMPAQLQARFPALAENIARQKWAAEQEAIHFGSEPAAGPDAFQAALRQWEAATLGGLAALNHTPPAKRVAHA